MEQEKLRELEQKCIQECRPPCTAACPVHVDVRSVTGHIVRGDLDAALKVLRKALPFPYIIGSICDQPCARVCNRGSTGGSIQIAALERACAEAGPGRVNIPLLPSRGKRIAVIGGGLSGLTAAFDLRKKGYSVTVFEKVDRPGGSLWSAAGNRVDADRGEQELSIIADMGAEVHINTASNPDAVSGFDAVYIAAGAGSYAPAVDSVTYEVAGREGVFAGGSLLRADGTFSPILSVADGRRAAVSIDRYLQGASLTAARAGEGSQQSILYTNLDEVEPVTPCVPEDPAKGLTREEAQREAARCLQCQCLECVKVCPYLESFEGYPKKYIREIYNNLSIVMGMRKSNKLINSCSLCGLCAEVCPNGLNMAEVCSAARRTMVGQKRMPPSAHDFALRDMLFANSDSCMLTSAGPGNEQCSYVFFPGCQLCASAPEHVVSAYNVLRDALDGDAGIMLGCCGTPADWAGRDDLCEQVRQDLASRHRQLGSPAIIIACPSCSRSLGKLLPDAETVSLWQMLDDRFFSVAPEQQKFANTVSIHDPCSARHDAGLHDSVRSIVKKAGCAIEELPLSRHKTTCCSYGGLMWFANFGVARKVIEQRVRESPADYITYCSMCRDLLASQGKNCLHLLDLLFEKDLHVRGMRQCPGWSQRRENRARLKNILRTQIEHSDMDESMHTAEPELLIEPDMQAILDKRFILIDEARQVIAAAERTGRKLVSSATGHSLAYSKIGSVTCWIEYSGPNEGAYRIHNAYSHRMEIVEGAGS